MDGNKQSSVIAAAVASLIVCITFYTLRIVARIVSRSRILWSDIFLFGGVIACVVISSVDLYVLRLGLGRQIAYVSVQDPELKGVVKMLKFLMVNNIAYAFGQVTVKISLCLLYRHLFTSTKLHMLIDLTIIYSVLWGIAFIGVAIGSCRPIHAFWDFTLQTLPTTYCINNRAWYLGQAIPNILTDILVLCMPIKQIWGLRLDRKSKSALVLIFALGIFVCVISVVRVYSLFSIDNANPTWTLVGIANWSSVEFAIAVMCASLPTLRPLLNLVHPKSAASQPTPQLAAVSIGGGRQYHSGGSKPSQKKGVFARMHGFESSIERDTVDMSMNDLETLVGHESYQGHHSPGKISVSTQVSVNHH